MLSKFGKFPNQISLFRKAYLLSGNAEGPVLFYLGLFDF
jgi:hypothetical protein